MDTGTTKILTLVMGLMLFILQRTEPGKRRLIALIMLVCAELIRRYVWLRAVHTEAWTALAAAIVLNFLFWVLIGRYNPVGSSDRIHVMGLDD
jgi:hypothetical protein